MRKLKIPLSIELAEEAVELIKTYYGFKSDAQVRQLLQAQIIKVLPFLTGEKKKDG